MSPEQDREAGAREQGYSARRDVIDMVIAVIAAASVLGAWFWVLPWIVVFVGGQ